MQPCMTSPALSVPGAREALQALSKAANKGGRLRGCAPGNDRPGRSAGQPDQRLSRVP
jgi:hypothetical protein